MKNLLYLFASLWLIAACSGNEKKQAQAPAKPTLEALKKHVANIEDSLKAGTLPMDPRGKTCVYYAEACMKIYEEYPQSKEAPGYLDRAHMVFSSCNLHRRAVVAGEELVKKYPSYKGRPMVLVSMASAYDMFITPRDKSKVRYYYELLLKENPSMPQEEKEMYEFRLEYIDLTSDELIELQQAKKQNS